MVIREQSCIQLSWFTETNNQTGWIVNFLDKFYWGVFDINIKMLTNDKRPELPIVYCVTQALPMFANAVGRLTPYYIGKASKSTEADLWCYIDEQDERGQEVGDVLMYFQHATLNLDDDGKLELQCESKKDKVETCRFKIDFFNIRVGYRYDNEPENLFSPNFFDEKVWSRIKPPHGNFIYSVMDLRPSIHTRKGTSTESKDLADIIKANPRQIFLEHGNNYKDKSSYDWSKKFLPFVVSVAVIEDLRG